MGALSPSGLLIFWAATFQPYTSTSLSIAPDLFFGWLSRCADAAATGCGLSSNDGADVVPATSLSPLERELCEWLPILACFSLPNPSSIRPSGVDLLILTPLVVVVSNRRRRGNV